MINSVDNPPLDFVLRTPLRAYGGAIVMALLPIVADAVVLAVYVLRHGWMNVPWQVITIFGALSFIGVGICIGLRCYKIRLTADRVEYRENPFPKSMRIEDVGAVYKAYRNNRPVILIASRCGPEADIVIDMMPFAGGELDKFLEMLLARMPEGSSVRRKSSRPRKRDSRVLFQAWLMLPISLLVFLILVFIGTTKLLQDGIAGTLQLVIAAGGFLVSYNMFSLDEERVVARLGIDPDTFRGKFLRFLDESISLMDTTLNMMQVNREIGLVRQIDVDRITVAKTNLETQKSSMLQALEVQKNLLKLQMGFPMTEAIVIPEINLDEMENRLQTAASPGFDITVLPAYRILEQQKNLAGLQYKSALYETLPVLVLAANYSYNYTGNDFSGPSYHSFPVSMVSLNLKMPLFTGMSKNAKIKKARIEMMKTDGDRETLEQSLTMAHSNARMQLEQQIRTIEAQRKNKDLAQEVFNVTEFNYNEGISSLSDVLNATSSLIEAQMNYVNALSGCMSAYIELKKTDGTIGEINQ